MQGNVISFQIDHTKLKPGIYLHEVKKINNHFITTFDFRFKRPNKKDYLTPLEAHTLEHVIATFFTENHKDKLYFGPMGCLTGFYLVLDGKHNVKEIINYLPKLDKYFKKLLKQNIVPAKSPYSCGNYQLLNIKDAYKVWYEFYSKRKQWGNQYIFLKDNKQINNQKYQNDINYNLLLKR